MSSGLHNHYSELFTWMVVYECNIYAHLCLCSYELINVSFSEFNFKWSFHIIDAYTHIKSSTCYPHLNFAFQVNDFMALRIANTKITNHATTDMAICILK